MRTRLVALAGSLFLGACVSGTRVVYVPVADASNTPVASPAPAPAPPPQVVEEPLPPIGVTIVRADQGRLLVSLDQPAYLAVFDIVPGRGISLLYPASPRQRQVVITGSRWLDPRWGTMVGYYDDGASGHYVRARDVSVTHYVYAVASDRPLRLTDGAFDDDILENMINVRASRAEDPYYIKDAISRQFVASVRDEDWGEDMYTMNAMRSVQTVRVARVYCGDGVVLYVRDELAAVTYCPMSRTARGSATRPTPPRPDSVVAWNGRPVPHSYDPNRRTPVYRVPAPIGGHSVGRTAEGRDNNGNNGRDNGNDGRDNGNNGRDNNGNHYGWNNGNNPHNPNNGNNGNNGNHNGWQNGNGNNGNNPNANTANANTNGNANNGNANNGNANNGNAGGQSVNQSGSGVQQQGEPQGQNHGQPQGNSQGNSQGNAQGQSQGDSHGNAKSQPHTARPEAQPGAEPEAPAQKKPSKLSDILKGAKKPAASSAPADTTKQASQPARP